MKRTVDVIVEGEIVRSWSICVTRIFGRTEDKDFLAEAYEAAYFDRGIPPDATFVVRETRQGDEEI